MTSYVTDGTVGPWAKEKLECLGKYLSAYTTIMKNQEHWCKGYYFIDAFAGAGNAPLRKYDGGQEHGDQLSILSILETEGSEVAYVKGSPRVALDIKHPFSGYFFVDKSVSNTSELEQIREEYAEKRNIEIVTGDSNVAVRSIVEEIGLSRSQKKRGIVFLDPFGMQVSWSTIEFLAHTGVVEVLINFPFGMAIQRLLPKSGEISAENRALLTKYFGSAEWESLIYEEGQNLFGETTRSKSDQAAKTLVRWYRTRLKALFGYAPLPRLITNTNGGHLYYLMFAGPNENGAKIAGDVLAQGSVVR